MTPAGARSIVCAFLLSSGFVVGRLFPSAGPKKVIINDDGGADDASALIQVLQQPDIHILAITCQFGNVDLEQACDNTRRTLQLMGKADEVPVYAGCDKPLVTDVVFDGFYGTDGFGNHSLEFPLPNATVRPQHAANAIVALVSLYPGEITLISLGPLTNLAVALKLDPALPSKLKEVFIMGGSSHALGNVEPVAEFNIYEDAEAARMVIDDFDCPMFIVPYELCRTYAPSWGWYYDWVSTSSSVAFFIEQTFEVAVRNMLQSNESFVDCDLMATTVFLYPEVGTGSTRNYAQVETCGYSTRGEFVVDYRPGVDVGTINVEIYTNLDFQLMLEKWMEITSSDQHPTLE